MSGPALRLLEPVLESLYETIALGRLVELSGTHEGGASARMTTAVSWVAHAQQLGETTAWIQPRGGPLFPPDLAHHGIDLDALLVIHVPAARAHHRHEPRSHTCAHQICKAAEVLLRSGAFGLVVLDFCDGAPSPGTEAWQGRLLGLARQHHSLVLMLTDKPTHADSLGALVGIRVAPRRWRQEPGRFVVEHEVLKNKSGAQLHARHDLYEGPWGLR